MNNIIYLRHPYKNFAELLRHIVPPVGVFQVVFSTDALSMDSYWLYKFSVLWKAPAVQLEPLPGKEKAAMLFLRANLPPDITIELCPNTKHED